MCTYVVSPPPLKSIQAKKAQSDNNKGPELHTTADVMARSTLAIDWSSFRSFGCTNPATKGRWLFAPRAHAPNGSVTNGLPSLTRQITIQTTHAHKPSNSKLPGLFDRPRGKRLSPKRPEMPGIWGLCGCPSPLGERGEEASEHSEPNNNT